MYWQDQSILEAARIDKISDPNNCGVYLAVRADTTKTYKEVNHKFDDFNLKLILIMVYTLPKFVSTSSVGIRTFGNK